MEPHDVISEWFYPDQGIELSRSVRAVAVGRQVYRDLSINLHLNLSVLSSLGNDKCKKCLKMITYVGLT